MATTRRRLLMATGFATLEVTTTHADGRLARHGRRLARLLRGPESARGIADAYLAGVGEINAHRAATALNMGAVLAPLDRIQGQVAARAFLGARIRADFADGAVIEVDGWRLSRTEVGACLLAADVA
jgi:hypothetical protein